MYKPITRSRGEYWLVTLVGSLIVLLHVIGYLRQLCS